MHVFGRWGGFDWDHRHPTQQLFRKVSPAGIEPVGFRVKSDLRNHCAIVQPRLYDSAMVTPITLAVCQFVASHLLKPPEVAPGLQAGADCEAHGPQAPRLWASGGVQVLVSTAHRVTTPGRGVLGPWGPGMQGCLGPPRRLHAALAGRDLGGARGRRVMVACMGSAGFASRGDDIWSDRAARGSCQ